MRLPDTGRACHPKVRPSSLRAYMMSEANPTTAYDSTRGATLQALFSDAYPAVIQGPTPGARRFTDGGSMSLGEAGLDDELRAALLGDCTIAVLCRLNSRTMPAANVSIVGYQAQDDDSSSTTNHVRLMQMTTTGAIRMFWEHGTGTDVSNTFSGFTMQPFEWTLIHVRLSGSTGVGPGGTIDGELFVNGSPVSSFVDATNASGGDSGRLTVGCRFNSGMTASAEKPPLDVAGVFIYGEALSSAEIEEDARRLRRSVFFTRTDTSVVTEDGDGAPRDLTDLEGIDFVDEVVITADVDQPSTTLDLTLLRTQEQVTLAMLVTGSKLNLGDVTDPGSYVLSLLRESAPIEVRCARVPLGISANEEDFEQGVVFVGEIDEIDDGAAEAITVSARDGSGRLLDTHIEEEVNYSDPSTPYAVEGEMQAILDDNDNDSGNNSVSGLSTRTGSYAPITLFTPTSPSWSVLGWRQRREPVLSALRALSAQIGWDVRYTYDADPAQRAYRLTFAGPQRDRVAAHAVVDPDDVLSIRSLRRSTFGRRTNVRVCYSSSETSAPTNPTPPSGYTVTSGWNNVDGEGNRVPAYVEVRSDTTLAATGKRQFMEFVEASSGQIDTITEAYAMALNSLRDLEDPGISKVLELPAMWEAEVNDVLRFRPVADLFTAAQTLTTQRVTLTLGERATTSITLRGAPSIGFKRWLRLEARPGNGSPGVMRPGDALTGTTSGTMLEVYRNILDRSGLLTGGKYVQLRNPDFRCFTSGLANAPDGWSMVAGVWGTDALAESATHLSGGRAVRFASTTAQLRSDPISVAGDQRQALGIECTWQRVSGDDLVQIDLDWLDSALAVISTQTIYPGATVSVNIGVDQFPAAPAGTGTWYRSRAEGFAPPTTAVRYARLTVRGRQVGGAFNPIIVDDVSVYRVASKQKNGVIDCVAYAGWAGFLTVLPGAAGVAGNIPIGAITQQGGGFGAGDLYDVVSHFPTRTVPTANGGYCDVPYSGIWRFCTKVWMTPVAFAAGDFAAIDLVLNGTYNPATGVRGGGTIIDSFRFQPLLHLQAGGIACFRAQIETRLVAGDRITVDLRNFAAGAGSTLVWAYGNALDAGATDVTYLQGQLLLGE